MEGGETHYVPSARLSLQINEMKVMEDIKLQSGPITVLPGQPAVFVIETTQIKMIVNFDVCCNEIWIIYVI